MKKGIVGVLLAGGLSSRYGEPKAFAMWHQKQFYEWSYDILAASCDHVVIVTRESLLDQFPKEVHTITDKEAFVGCGPLAGIYSAMDQVEGDMYVVLPCDMPLMKLEVIKGLIQLHQKSVTVVQTEEHLQALVSVWDKSMKEKIYEALQEGQYKMRTVLCESYVDIVQSKDLTRSDDVFLNVNTKEDERGLMK